MTVDEYERRLATALDECITIWNRAHNEGRDIYPPEVASIGDIIRGRLARVPWVEIDVTGVQGPSIQQGGRITKAEREELQALDKFIELQGGSEMTEKQWERWQELNEKLAAPQE